MLINIFKGEDYFIGTIKQFPEVVTQGKYVTSTIKNLADALHLYMETWQMRINQ